jgi:TRAP-type C4-dicarboxylate transport system permease small subunit
MKKAFSAMTRTIEKINYIQWVISGFLILAAALVLTYEVIMRYMLNIPTIWEVEASVYLIIMATFLGAPYGIKEGSHIGIELVTVHLSSRTTAGLTIITAFISWIFCLLVAWKGWEMWWEAFSKGWRSESLWGPPLAVPYFFLPLGMSLLSLQYIIFMYRKIADFRDLR